MALGLVGNSYADIFGTNSSQTNFVIPAGDSVNLWGVYTKDTNVILDSGFRTSCIMDTTQVIRTITNTIVYVRNKPTIASLTNSVTNNISIELANNPGLQINGPATLSLVNCWINYKYNKKSQGLVLMAPAGNTNALTVLIPSGKSFYCANQVGLTGLDANIGFDRILYDIKLNDQNIYKDEYSYNLPAIYGPATLKLIPPNPPIEEPVYINYIIQ